MSFGKGADTLRIALQAGVTRQLTAQGQTLTIFEGAAMDVTVKAKATDLGKFVGIERGVTLDFGEAFDRLEITSAVDQTAVLITSFGEVKDRRFSLPSAGLPVFEAGGDLGELPSAAVGAGASVQIAGQNITRRSLLVRNSGLVPLFLRSDAATAASALELSPGNTLSLDVSNAVYAYNSTGSAGAVEVQEIA